MDSSRGNFSPHELDKFKARAHSWWDPDGDFKPLHDINPLRLEYLKKYTKINGQRVLDVGCGGGLLCEAMAAHGAQVTGIDLSESALQVARLHLEESGLHVDYHHDTAEAHAHDHSGYYDVVTCMEMLEHVPDPASVIAASARLVRDGGSLFFSTINRNPTSYLLAIIGAEYLLKLLPRGTHDYRKLIRPSELTHAAGDAGLELVDLTGITYHPLTRTYKLGSDVRINYLAYFQKPS